MKKRVKTQRFCLTEKLHDKERNAPHRWFLLYIVCNKKRDAGTDFVCAASPKHAILYSIHFERKTPYGKKTDHC